MPVKLVCAGCGALLMEGESVELVKVAFRRHGGRCPACGRSLSERPLEIEVRVLDPPKPLL